MSPLSHAARVRLPGDAKASHHPAEEYGVGPVIPQFRFTSTSLLRHSSLHRLPWSKLVSPLTTDQNPFFPTPQTLNNEGLLESPFSSEKSEHISINSRKAI